MPAPSMESLVQTPSTGISLHSSKRAFSLIELLSAMVLISILTVATVPALRGTLDGFNVSGAAGVAEAEMSLARQTAISRNLPVEVRFYKYDDGSGNAWRLMAVVIPAWASGQAADEWISNGRVLPGNVVLDDGSEYSTILSKAAGSSGSGKKAPWVAQESTSAPRLLQGRSYVGFLFNADGSTNLPNDQPWCLTLKNPHSKPSETGPAANYVSLVVDSATGRTLSYQP